MLLMSHIKAIADVIKSHRYSRVNYDDVQENKNRPSCLSEQTLEYSVLINRLIDESQFE
jgi:hypothetical protein